MLGGFQTNLYTYTLWWFNVAMENKHFEEVNHNVYP